MLLSNLLISYLAFLNRNSVLSIRSSEEWDEIIATLQAREAAADLSDGVMNKTVVKTA